jgi:hypothetical protein
MTYRINESNSQPLVDPRANLFYFLQQLSRQAEVKDCKRGSESLVSDDSIGLDAWRATTMYTNARP